MNRLTYRLMATALWAITLPAFASDIPPDHPILGTWKFDLPDIACFEIYEFRPDGIDHVISRDQIEDSRYEVSTTPNERGFYTLTDTVIAGNGKKDCIGQTSQIGDVANGYAIFDPSNQQMYLCSAHVPKLCMGPLIRINTTKARQP